MKHFYELYEENIENTKFHNNIYILKTKSKLPDDGD